MMKGYKLLYKFQN